MQMSNNKICKFVELFVVCNDPRIERLLIKKYKYTHGVQVPAGSE